MIDVDRYLCGWTPAAHFHWCIMLLKRIVYGRRYSKPRDHYFQDYHWEAWERKQKERAAKNLGIMYTDNFAIQWGHATQLWEEDKIWSQRYVIGVLFGLIATTFGVILQFVYM